MAVRDTRPDYPPEYDEWTEDEAREEIAELRAQLTARPVRCCKGCPDCVGIGVGAELRGLREELDEAERRFAAAEAERDALREALAFYEAESNYFGVGGGAGAPEMTTAPIMRDLGRTARYALGTAPAEEVRGNRAGAGSDRGASEARLAAAARERDAYRLRLEAMREALDAAMANPDQALDILRDHARVLTRNLATQPAPAEPAPKPFRERCKHSFDSADPLLDTGSATCLECGVRIPISTEPSTADGGEGE